MLKLEVVLSVTASGTDFSRVLSDGTSLAIGSIGVSSEAGCRGAD